MIEVVALGEMLIDFTVKGTDAHGYPTMAANPGGAPPNYLAALQKFGVNTAMLAKVGNDTFGRLLLETFRSVGISTQGVVIANDVFTTLAFVMLDAQGDREFAFARKPGADTQLAFEELSLTLIDEARVFHFGTLSLTDEPARSATRRAVAYAKVRGKLISLDPNLRKPLWCDLNTAKNEICWALGQADVVKISDEEIDFLFGCSCEEGASKLIHEYGVSLVFATQGKQGCIFKNPVAEGHVDNFNEGIRAVDTTGAGDIFGGAAMSKLLRMGKAPGVLTKQELVQITTFACAAASLSTQLYGGVCSVPEYEAVLRLVATRG